MKNRMTKAILCIVLVFSMFLPSLATLFTFAEPAIIGDNTVIYNNSSYIRETAVFVQSVYREKETIIKEKASEFNTLKESAKDVYKLKSYDKALGKTTAKFIDMLNGKADFNDVLSTTYFAALQAIASCYGLGGAVEAISNALFDDGSPSENAVLQQVISEQFKDLDVKLDDLKDAIHDISNDINSGVITIIAELKDCIEASDAKRRVEEFVSSGSGNFSFSQFTEFLYGDSSAQSYYFNLLRQISQSNQFSADADFESSNLFEHIVNLDSSKDAFDALYRALCSVRLGDSNVNKLKGYLLPEDASLSSIVIDYYTYLKSNSGRLPDGITPEHAAVEFAQMVYASALRAQTCIRICNMFQALYLKDKYADDSEKLLDATYRFGSDDDDVISYGMINNGDALFIKDENAFLYQITKDIMTILGADGSYTVKEADGELRIITNEDRDSFGNVTIGETVYLNVLNCREICEKFQIDPASFNYIFTVNGAKQETDGSFLIPENCVALSADVYYLDFSTPVYSVDFKINRNAAAFIGGIGSKEDPYRINNAEQLKCVEFDKCYKLIADVNMNGAAFEPLCSKKAYKGVFDGNGHTISNLIIKANNLQNVGLFASLDGGIIKGLTIQNMSVQLTSSCEQELNVGAIAGKMIGGRIEGCSIKDSSISVTQDIGDKLFGHNVCLSVGGLVGYCDQGTVTKTSVENTKVSAESSRFISGNEIANQNETNAGGLIGKGTSICAKECVFVVPDGMPNNDYIVAKTNSSFGVVVGNKAPYCKAYTGGIIACDNSDKDHKSIYESVYSKTEGSSSTTVVNTEETGRIIVNVLFFWPVFFNNDSGNYNNCHKNSDKYIAIGASVDNGQQLTEARLPLYVQSLPEVSCKYSEKWAENSTEPGYGEYTAGQVYTSYEPYFHDDHLILNTDDLPKEYDLIMYYGFDSRNDDRKEACNSSVRVLFFEKNRTVYEAAVDIVILENRPVELLVNNVGHNISELTHSVEYRSDRNDISLLWQNGDMEDVSQTAEVSLDGTMLNHGDAIPCGDSEISVTYCTASGAKDYRFDTVFTLRINQHRLTPLLDDQGNQIETDSCIAQRGYKEYYCEVCNKNVKRYKDSVDKHLYVEVEDTNGSVFHECSVCHARGIHQYVSEYSAAGELEYRCLDCSYIYPESAGVISEDQPLMIVTDGYALPGKHLVTVYVNLHNNPGIDGTEINILYDQRLKVVDIKPGDSLEWFGNYIKEKYDKNFSVASLYGYNEERIWLAAVSGDYIIKYYGVEKKTFSLFAITFETPETADADDVYDLIITEPSSRDHRHSSVTTLNNRIMNMLTSSGQIRISKHLPGDVNDDNEVDLADVLCVLGILKERQVGNGFVIPENLEIYADVDLTFTDDPAHRISIQDVSVLLTYVQGAGSLRGSHYSVKLDYNDGVTPSEQHPVTLYKNDDKGINENNFATYDFIKTLPTVDTVQRPGFLFDGWYSNLVGTEKGEPVTGDQTVIYNQRQSKQTLYAHWTQNTVRFFNLVSVDADGFTHFEEAPAVTYSYDLSGNPEKNLISLENVFSDSSGNSFHFTYQNCDFIGWSETPNGEVIYHENNVLDLSKPNIGVKNLYAVYQSKLEYEYNEKGFYIVKGLGDLNAVDCTSLTIPAYHDNTVHGRLPVKEIAANAFNGLTAIQTVYVCDNVTTIGASAFEGCTDLKTVTLPDSLTSVGDSAFSGCSALTSLTFPDSIKTIGKYAFYNCQSLTSIIIPDSVTGIDGGAFQGCTNLSSVHLGTGITCIVWDTFRNCERLTEITIPENVAVISTNAFRNCSALQTVMISYGVSEILAGAFSSCTSLTSIIVPDSVTSIGQSVFNGCDSLTDITVPFVGRNSSGGYFGYIFNDDEYPETNRGIPSSLRNVVITGGSISPQAFKYCSGITSVKLPEELTEINFGTFSDCTNLETVLIPNSVTVIGNWVFWECSALKNIHITSNVTTIGDGAFYGCASLTSVTIPNTLTVISESVFYGCSGLTNITIPNSITSIQNAAFHSCTNLVSITLPASLTIIGDAAFESCGNLKSVYFEGSLEQWCTISFGSGLFICTNPCWNGADLYIDGSLITEVRIPDGLTSIHHFAFCGATIKSVIIPDGVTSIERMAFGRCSKLEDVTISESLISIGEDAFCNSNLKTITIPEGVTSIGDRSFEACSSLQSAVFPHSLTSIGESAFAGCNALIHVVYNGAEHEWNCIPGSNDEPLKSAEKTFNADYWVIEYNRNGYTGGVASDGFHRTDIDDYPVPENVFSRSGFIFGGWNTKPDGTGVYCAKQEDVPEECIVNHTAKLYAIWRVDPYTIGQHHELYNIPNGGTVADTDGLNVYRLYYDIANTPDIIPEYGGEGKVIVDWSAVTGDIDYIDTVQFHGQNSDFQIWPPVRDVYFIGNSAVTYSRANIFCVYFTHEYTPTFHFKDFKIYDSSLNVWAHIINETTGEYVINEESDRLYNRSLILDIHGDCSIVGIGGNSVIKTYKSVTVTGDGSLTLAAECTRGQYVQPVYADDLVFENQNVYIRLSTPDSVSGCDFFGWFKNDSKLTEPEEHEYSSLISPDDAKAVYYPKWYKTLSITAASTDDLQQISGTESRYIYVYGGSGIDNKDISKYRWYVDNTESGGAATLDFEAFESDRICFVLRVTKTLDNKSGIATVYVTDTETKKTISVSNSWSTSKCFTGDTLVLTPDREYVRLDTLKAGDIVMSWNPITGAFEAMPISLYWNHGDGYHNLIKLNFSNGKQVKVVEEHGFFDATLKKIVYINEDNYTEYIGHAFAHMNGDTFEEVILESAESTYEYTSCYSLRTACNDNVIVEGFLTLTFEDFPGLLTYFEYGDGYKYDEEKMARDIETYGLYTYDEWKDYVTYEEFIALNGPYMKIVVGKGYLTEEDIFMLIAGMR